VTASVHWLLRGYKRVISPVLPNACRFYPSCSDYASEAIELHGIIRGVALTTWRLLRCQPFSRGGFDPVPTTAMDHAHVNALQHK
jgi:putative membrane protein insertion efficiency factor